MTSSDNTTESNATASEEEKYLNRRVAKRFGENGIFFGTVVSIDKEHELYMIRYDDDDEEELDSRQLKRALRFYGRRGKEDQKFSNHSADPEKTDEMKEEEPGSDKICDLCQYKDGKHGLTLIECIQCKVSVHRECYGLTSYQGRKFLCWACQSVGKSIPSSDNKMVKVTERPNICELCNVLDGKLHAMHPLYDNYGTKGRQIYVNGENGQEGRLAWAHSLCAFTLSRHRHMFGVQANGTTHEQIEEDPGDTRSENEHLQEVDEDIDDDGAEIWGEHAPMHHFVYYTKHPWHDIMADNYITVNDTRSTARALKFIKESQLELRCSICHSDDKSLRFAIQCSANMDTEYNGFKGTHSRTLPGNSKCTMAMHIGCALWREEATKHLDKATMANDTTHTEICKQASAPMGNKDNGKAAAELKESATETCTKITSNNADDTETSSHCRRVFSFPGYGRKNPVYGLYCDVHARDVDKEYRQEMEDDEKEKEKILKNKRKRKMNNKGFESGIYKDEPKVKRLQGNLSRFKKQLTDELLEKVVPLETPEEKKQQRIIIKKKWKKKFENEGFSKEAFNNAYKECKEKVKTSRN